MPSPLAGPTAFGHTFEASSALKCRFDFRARGRCVRARSDLSDHERYRFSRSRQLAAAIEMVGAATDFVVKVGFGSAEKYSTDSSKLSAASRTWYSVPCVRPVSSADTFCVPAQRRSDLQRQRSSTLQSLDQPSTRSRSTFPGPPGWTTRRDLGGGVAHSADGIYGDRRRGGRGGGGGERKDCEGHSEDEDDAGGEGRAGGRYPEGWAPLSLHRVNFPNSAVACGLTSRSPSLLFVSASDDVGHETLLCG